MNRTTIIDKYASSLTVQILRGERERMDTSLQRANLAVDELTTSLETYQEAEEAEHHIHMPGPSAWPFMLSAAILAAVIGLLFIPDAPWLTLCAVPFIIWG